MLRGIVCALALLTTQCLLVPLYNQYPRCMIVFAFGQKETVKIDMKFPPIPGRQPNQNYQIMYRNTEPGGESFQQQSGPGVYRKELEIAQSVIYEVCFWCNTDREVGQLNVEYGAMVEFYFKQEEIKVPDSLVKTKDLVETYMNAAKIKEVGERFLDMQKRRSEAQQKSFEQTRQVGALLAFLSMIELVLFVVAGIVQLILVRGFIVKRVYI